MLRVTVVLELVLGKSPALTGSYHPGAGSEVCLEPSLPVRGQRLQWDGAGPCCSGQR